MPPIDITERSRDRGNHLVDLLADGLGRETDTRPSDDRFLRHAYILAGTGGALLFTAVVAVLLS